MSELTYNESHLQAMIDSMKNTISNFSSMDDIPWVVAENWYGRLYTYRCNSETIKRHCEHDVSMLKEFDDCIDEVSRQLTKSTGWY